MNLDDIEQLRAPLRSLLDSASRQNIFKSQKYWYPLSIATYDIEEVLAAVDSLCSFRTTMWEKTADFETQFSAFVGRREGVMVNSGSSADLILMFGLVNPQIGRVQPGAEILMPSVTWPTQIWSAMMAGLKPIFVDTDPATLNMDMGDLESKISTNTGAISVVHLMGNPCDMHEIGALCTPNDIAIVEDCCEAFGARFAGQPVGSFGIAGTYSFFFSHHITTMEGGMVCCDDAGLSDVLRLLRAHGWARNTKYLDLPAIDGIDPRYMFLNWGLNVRPTDIQASFGLQQLNKAPRFLKNRVANAEALRAHLARYPFFEPLDTHKDAECSWFAFPIVIRDYAPFSRQDILHHLETSGVETRPIVAGSLARHPVRELFPELQQGALPGADLVHERGFYVGIYPFEMSEELERLMETFDAFLVRY